MAFTRVVGPGIHTQANIHSHNIQSTGIITAVGLDVNGVLEITLSDVKAVSGQSLTGFKVGEVLRPKQSSLDLSNIQGTGLTIAIKSIVPTSIDTLFLTDVQGEEFVSGEDLVHYGAANDTRTVVETTVAKTNGTSTVNGDKYNGNVMEVLQHKPTKVDLTFSIEQPLFDLKRISVLALVNQLALD
mgnify:CR=1 FL=1